MDLYDSISPIDYRYYGNNKAIFDKIQPFLSENAFVKYQLKVEAALAKALAKHGVCQDKQAKEISQAAGQIAPEEVYEEDKKTKHYTRALVNVIRSKVSDEAKPFVHFTATSFDINDTANSMRFKEFTEKVLLPDLKEFEKTLIALASREKATLQVGRTHGQHAVPITFGFYLSEYVSRIGNAVKKIELANENLVGQLSGAVGAYNSQSLFVKDPVALENDFLKELNLKPASHSKQIIEPEHLLGLLHEVVACFGVLANLADDMRHLQRTEINEVAEKFESKTQVGSSTMPHKRNPWNFENVKSMWKEMMPRLNTYYMDQISEHQRDLSNSASSRFIPELFAVFTESLNRLHGLMGRLVVDKEAMKKNFDLTGKKVVAEPLYLLLAFYGHPDAHEAVRKLAVQAQETGQGVFELAEADQELKPYLDKFSKEQRKVLEDPANYTGLAAKKAEQVCAYWQKELKL